MRWLLAAVLAAAAVSKLFGAEQSRVALRSWGLQSSGTQRAAWLSLVLLDAALAATLATDIPGAPAASAATFSIFAVGLWVQLARGRGGAPCGCFGSRSRISKAALARTIVLAAACASIPALSSVRPTTHAWLVAGLLAALVAIAGLVVAVLALAREVGELRLSLGPQSALSIASEGPPLGSRPAMINRFDLPADLALGVFSSTTCPICDALEPAVRLVGREPGIAVQVFDEARDADVWQALGIPGGPYAVVLDGNGVVVSKGTFNTLAQLEGVLAAAERRSEVGRA
jgi:Methylamine utilisation protein MauE